MTGRKGHSDIDEDLVERLARARRVAVLTGAGISAESGIPTFRDADGVWQRFKPEELATIAGLLRNPAAVQEWYALRRRVIEENKPNPGHYTLAEMEQMFDVFTLITQNVDGLHQKAGSTDVVELHGNLFRNFCIDCGRDATPDQLTGIAECKIARCSSCSGLIRPGVVWFGEMLPEEGLERAGQAAATADVFLSVGTSGAVYPAAGIPLRARAFGAFVAEINIERSDIAYHLDAVILGKAGEVLPRIAEGVRKRRAQG